jgi:hypothetical protein
MKFINMYLVGYIVLVVGGILALWKSGVLEHISGAWIAIGAVVLIGIGVMASVSAGKPEITKQ